MAEKKTKRVTDVMPYVILILVLLSTVLILIEVTGHLVNEGVISTEQVPNIRAPTSTPTPSTPPGPTPTLPPIIDA